jgi:hypothetical protein
MGVKLGVSHYGKNTYSEQCVEENIRTYEGVSNERLEKAAQ